LQTHHRPPAQCRELVESGLPVRRMNDQLDRL
jgi:hypothetical protein